jgi:hypothetical protein
MSNKKYLAKEKTLRVIKSCVTIQQLDNAVRYLYYFDKMFKDDNDFNYLLTVLTTKQRTFQV